MAHISQSVIRWLNRILRGVGQVFFLENAISGALLLLGIGINSIPMLIGTIIGTTSATITALLIKCRKEDVDKGLLGFNGALVGIGVILFCGYSPISLVTLVIGAALSTLIAVLFQKAKIPAYTFPFVLVVWGVILLVNAGLLPHAVKSGEGLNIGVFDLWSDLTSSIGQVMFQSNSILTAILFALAILIASHELALYAFCALTLSLLVALFDIFPIAEVNTGLYGYNAILVAMAVGSLSAKGFGKILIGVSLTILLQYIGLKGGLPTLTAPFVFATWIVLAGSRLIKRA